MRAILLDFVSRWRWVYVATLLPMVILISGGGKNGPLLSLGLLLGIAWGALPLSWDLMRGAGKVLHTLPVTRRQAARSYWHLSVGLPTLFNAVVLLSCAAWSALALGTSAMTLAQIIILSWLTFAWLGILLLVLLVMPVGPQHGFWNNLLGAICGLLWGGGVGGALFVSHSFPNQWSQIRGWQWILLIGGSALALTAWHYSEELLMRRTMLRRTSTFRSRPRRRAAPSRGALQGLSSLWWKVVWQSAVYALAFLILALLFHVLINRGTTWPESEDSYGTWKNHLFFCNIAVIMLCLFCLLRWIQSLRAWRVLPLTSHQLSLHLFLLALGPGAVFWLVVFTASLALGIPEVMVAWSKTLMLLAGGVSLLVPLGLRIGLNVLLLLIVVGLTGLTPLLTVLAEEVEISMGASLATGVCLLACGYLACHRIITHRSEGYRPLNLSWGQPP